MYMKCPHSCNVCKSSTRLECHDFNTTQCDIWAKAAECHKNPETVIPICPDACGVCTNVCIDKEDSCKGWAKAGECDKESSKAFMSKTCPQACGVCHQLEKMGATKDEL
mmetsp:Transcript_15512/g.52330  ORF Transcript_15512/g.52330 Transcript_15512/m.52330 type:complete len:109 (-) Transcript_15512:382-708(-)